MTNAVYHQAGGTLRPSPRVWADCPGMSLIQDGLGYWFHEEFFGVSPEIYATGEPRDSFGPFAFDCDDDTVTTMKASEQGGYLDIETDSDDNDGFCLFTEPLIAIVPNSGKKIWLEGVMEFGVVAGDQGFFFGLCEETNLDLDVIADDCADLVGETLIGFRGIGTNGMSGTTEIDCVAQLDGGAEVELLANVSDADALGDNGASLANNTEYKLGLKFDGQETVEVFVRGVHCADWALSTTYYDSSKKLCVACALKAGTTTAVSMAIDWIRYGGLY